MGNESNTSPTGGQAPTGGQPQAGIPGSSSQQQPTTSSQAGGDNQTGQSQSSGQASATQARTPDEYEHIIADLRREAAGHRTRNSTLEADLKKFQDAQLSETEKAQRAAAEWQRKHDDLQRSTQERIVRAEVKAAAAGIGLDPALASRLIDYAEISFDEDTGEPKNLGKLLEQLVKQYPYLAQSGAGQGQGGQQTPQNRPPSSGSPANPPRTGSASAPLTWEYITTLTPTEYDTRRQEIQAWMAKNPPRR